MRDVLAKMREISQHAGFPAPYCGTVDTYQKYTGSSKLIAAYHSATPISGEQLLSL